jgi:hypothetical protein
MKSFITMVGTFMAVYFVVPWTVYQVLVRLGVVNPTHGALGITFLITFATYALFKRMLGERMPPI